MSAVAFTLRQTVVPLVTKGAQPLNFLVRRVYCVGQNYDAHAREMGAVTNRLNRFFFCHPTDSIVTDLGNHSSPSCALRIHYPPLTESYHHEVELVVAIGLPWSKSQRPYNNSHEHALPRYASVTVEEAPDIVYAYGVGLDMTRRDLQSEAKTKGHPWDLAKGADESAVVSPLVLAPDLKAAHPELFIDAEKHEHKTVWGGEIFLSVNQNERQRGDLSCMVSRVPELIAHLSKAVALQPGDLIFTGTPSGVGAVRPGDVIMAGIQGIGTLNVTVV